MRVSGKDYRAIWFEDDSVRMIDQTKLPFGFEIVTSRHYSDTARAIKDMTVRGAGTIGAAAGFAMAQAALSAPKAGYDSYLDNAKRQIDSTRPTAVDLFHATERVYNAAKSNPNAALGEAQKIADEYAERAEMIGKHGERLIKSGARVATHCNAGWLALVDWGSALAPIYAAHRNGKKLFVYADETRPRGQGARLTAWELRNEGVPHAIIPDNATAHYMQRGEIDLMIVGADRIARNGDTANKIGTLEKAVCAHEFGVPFYVAAPTSTVDRNCKSGKDIPIEERSEDEVLYQYGLAAGETNRVLVCSPGSHAKNPAFDVTPAKYVRGFITENGIVSAKKIRWLK